MKLQYSVRSRFFATIEKALPTYASVRELDVRVFLGPGGYELDVEILIHADDAGWFDVDWENRDPSRFPARLRAAATVLKQRGYAGAFLIGHREGTLTIRRP
jgi:hypothetical protein